MEALRAGVSVHVQITTSSSGGSVVFSDDATAAGGRQVITVNKNEHTTVLLIGGVDYVQGDAAALQGFYGLPPAQAQQAAGEWISIKPGQKLGQSAYADVTAGITLASVASETQFGGPYTAVKQTSVDGQQVDGVSAPVPADAKLPKGARSVLYVAAGAPYRPVVSEVQGAPGVTNTTAFSDWGEKLQLSVPAHPVPAPDISAGATSLA